MDNSGVRKWRIVIDYRDLNAVSLSDAYPIPNITTILERVGGANYYSVLDLANGFWHVNLHPDSRKYTAFSTEFGHFHFKKLAFGLKNAPAIF